jgi:hypothetical protein
VAIQPRGLEQLQVFTVLKPTNVDANAEIGGVDLGGVDGDALFILNAIASGAANKTIKIKLVHSDASDGTYTDVPGGAFADLGNADVQQKLSIPREELKRYYKLKTTDLANAYEAYVSCVAVGPARYAV